MRLRIALDGRAREVFVEGEPPQLRVTVEGRPATVRVEVRDGEANVDVEGRTIHLAFGGGVRIDGTPRVARVEWLPEEEPVEGAPTVFDVRPPMPGRIVRVAVAPGDAVRQGTPLVVLEAMKMQNEIPAPEAGTVQEVRVREGDAVAATDVLVRVSRGRAGKPS